MEGKNAEGVSLVAELQASAPGIMAELMRGFIAARDLNSRARVRMQMKALLDLFSVDTEYPPVPPLNEEQTLMRDLQRGQFPGLPPGQFVPRVGQPLPAIGQPGLAEAVAEAVEPRGPVPDRVLPAPGAAMAGEEGRTR